MSNIKLFPPNIEGTIPAFTGTTLVVPFSMNKAVSINEVGKMVVKIKTAQNDLFITTIDSTSFNNKEAVFEVNYPFVVGVSYKLQLAYRHKQDDTVGYYSTVGVVKYTKRPKVSIAGLTSESSNASSSEQLVGVYSQKEGDVTEKVYSYRFEIMDSNESLIEDSGELIHNSTEDVESYESRDIYTPKTSINNEGMYYVRYSVTTRNGFKARSPLYKLVIMESIKPETCPKLIATLNFDQGYVQLNCEDEVSSQGTTLRTGNGLYELSRRKKGGNWEALTKFSLQGVLFSTWSFKDFLIEQGVEYTYAIRQYAKTSGLYSDRKFIMSNPVFADYEDMFLFDGIRQLRIKFNPEMSSFKTNVQENKTDTIGGKYPYFFRNGVISYKEFPINGLISFNSDDEELFLRKEEYGLVEEKGNRTETGTELESKGYADTDLVSQNIYSERIFKLGVLDWLNNGSTKVFKSCTEGNYLVRIMNASLSPNTTVGRVLHTFQCTAYEAGPCEYEQMIKNKLITIEEPETAQIKYKTIQLHPKDNKTGVAKRYVLGELLDSPFKLKGIIAQSVEFTDMNPGDRVMVDGELFLIGSTGTLTLNNVHSIKSIYIPGQPGPDGETVGCEGNALVSYFSEGKSEFDIAKEVEFIEVPVGQFVGEENTKNGGGDLLSLLTNIKDEVINWNILRFTGRTVNDVFIKSVKQTKGATSNEFELFDSNGDPIYYRDKTCTLYPYVGFNHWDVERWNKKHPDFSGEAENFMPLELYKIRQFKEPEKEKVDNIVPDGFEKYAGYYYDRQIDKFFPLVGSFLDPYYKKRISNEDYDPTVIFNEQKDGEKNWTTSLEGEKIYEVQGMTREDVLNLQIGNGVYLDTSYVIRRKTLLFEVDAMNYPLSVNNHNNWIKSIKDYQEFMASRVSFNPNEEIMNNEQWYNKSRELAKTIKEKYRILIEQLDKDYKQYAKDHVLSEGGGEDSWAPQPIY